MEEESWRRNHGGDIIDEESWRRNHGEDIIDEESWKRNHGGGIMEETSLMRNRGGGIWRRRHRLSWELSGHSLGLSGSSLGTLWGSLEAGVALGWPGAVWNQKVLLFIVFYSKNKKRDHSAAEW
jgi:hypothetical protein